MVHWPALILHYPAASGLWHNARRLIFSHGTVAANSFFV
jgi:hypothetical protein